MKFYQKKKRMSMWIAAFIFACAVILFRQFIVLIPEIFHIVRLIFSVLRPFIVGLIIAFILYVPCNKFEKLIKKPKSPQFIAKHSRGFSILVVYILGLAVIFVVLVLVLPWLVQSIIGLYNNRAVYYDNVKDFILSKCDSNGKFFGFDPNPIVEAVNPDKYLGKINIDYLTSIANGVYRFGVAIVEAILAIFSSVYMLASRETLIRSGGRFMTLFFPKRIVRKTYDYLCRICGIFYSYIYSALIDALVVAILSTIAFSIIGVDYAPLFGFIVGVANLIPYFGAIISGFGASLFAVMTDGFITGIITAASILLIQQLDCNIFQPKIIGKNVGVPPLLTLVAITVGGGFFGFAGILLGVPVAATVQMIVSETLDWHDRRNSLKEELASESADNSDEKPPEK